MILIYTYKITNRIVYAMDLVFANVLGIDYQLTEDIEKYRASSQIKLAYSNIDRSFEIFIKADRLLFESDIRKELPETEGDYLGFPQFFKSNVPSFLPYDIFATVFYFATRYEEYVSSELDQHKRFKAENSLAYKHHFLQKPFLHYLIEDFGKKLQQRFPQLQSKKRAFNFLSTIDIDNAFAYAGKGFKRNIGGAVKDVLKLKTKDIATRFKSNFNSEKDPYNTFNQINALSQNTQTALQYFVLIGDYSQYDKNPHYSNKKFRTLLKSLSEEFPIGLHPSYNAYNVLEKISIEKKRLEDIIEKNVTSARCHFLRIKFPETYRTYIREGITDDYTMIYASQCGFRTGLCVPHKWFDLGKNKTTFLTIHPSTVMEGVLRDYNKLSVYDAQQTVDNLMNEVKQFGGEFVSVWHNDSFVPQQQKWIELYKQMLLNSKH